MSARSVSGRSAGLRQGRSGNAHRLRSPAASRCSPCVPASSLLSLPGIAAAMIGHRSGTGVLGAHARTERSPAKRRGRSNVEKLVAGSCRRWLDAGFACRAGAGDDPRRLDHPGGGSQVLDHAAARPVPQPRQDLQDRVHAVPGHGADGAGHGGRRARLLDAGAAVARQRRPAGQSAGLHHRPARGRASRQLLRLLGGEGRLARSRPWPT